MKPKEIAKRILALLLALIMSVMCCACSGDDGSKPGGDGEKKPNTEKVPSNSNDSGGSSDKPSINLGNSTSAVNKGASSKYDISGGKAYIADMSFIEGRKNCSWVLLMQVVPGFTLGEIEKVGCCNSFLEALDVDIKIELEDDALKFTFTANGFGTEESFPAMYLVIVCGSLSEDVDTSYKILSDNSPEGSNKTSLKKMTGNVTFGKKLSDFSEGYAWAELIYSDTNAKTAAIIDKEGNVSASTTETDIYEFGEFHSGVSLIRHRNSDDSVMFEYVDKDNKVIFSSEDKDYHDYIKGMFDDGYIFMEKTEADLTSSTEYYTIMDCHKNLLFDWIPYPENEAYCMRIYNYLGGGVFMMADRRIDYDSPLGLYNINTGTTTCIDRYYSDLQDYSFCRQPDNIASLSDGWVVIETRGRKIFASTKTGEYEGISAEQYGLPSEHKIFVLETGFDDDGDRYTKWYYIDTLTGSQVPLNYKHIDLAVEPSVIYETMLPTVQAMVLWPSYNYLSRDYTTSNLKNKSGTSYYDYQFSHDVMLLSLKGADESDYYALMDTNGNDVFEPVKGKAVATLGEGRFLVEKDGVKFIIDEKGTRIDIMPGKGLSSIVEIEPYHEGIAWVSGGEEVGAFIDTSGNYVFGTGDSLYTVETVTASDLVPAEE